MKLKRLVEILQNELNAGNGDYPVFISDDLHQCFELVTDVLTDHSLKRIEIEHYRGIMED